MNLTGTFNCVQAAVPDMVAAGWGRIVTISSSSAQSGAPNMAALRGLEGRGHRAHQGARRRPVAPRHHRQHDPAVARRHADGPGRRRAGATSRGSTCRTSFPIRRASTPADIAAACAFLCSDDGSYITGQIIGVNGGMYM